ncbi:MAG: hypothetical protein IJB82_04870 [Bacilli bacterium]|nr:hypothetical protein [Bacilli bacterium]
MRKNLLAPIILGFLSLTSFGAGAIGLVQSMDKEPLDQNTEYIIKYNYYVDDEEVTSLPTNKNKNKPDYVFNRYSCTNKVTGEWNENTWTFTPTITNNATCKLYFNKANYKINFNIEYGELRNNNGTLLSDEQKEKGFTVEREKDYVAKIVPDEGYSLVSVECDKENVTNWDKENNELTVKNVKEDTTCKVKFGISNYEVKINVVGGAGTTTLNVDHGNQVNSVVTPNAGYGNAKITCSNGQTGVWQDNKFTIEKITNTTECAVEFSILAYEIKVNVDGGTATPSSYTVHYNSSKKFTITPDKGYTVSEGYGVTGCPTGTLKYSNGELELTVSDVTTDLTCNVTLKKLPEEESSSTQEIENGES